MDPLTMMVGLMIGGILLNKGIDWASGKMGAEKDLMKAQMAVMGNQAKSAAEGNRMQYGYMDKALREQKSDKLRGERREDFRSIMELEQRDKDRQAAMIANALQMGMQATRPEPMDTTNLSLISLLRD
jgi:hypothetical protein